MSPNTTAALVGIAAGILGAFAGLYIGVRWGLPYIDRETAV